MQPVITNNPSYLYPNVNKILNNFTKYVSKPLGFDRPYNETKSKHGNTMKLFCLVHSSFFAETSFLNEFQEVEYASSLILQVSIYFNVYYFPCWFIGNCFIWPVVVSPYLYSSAQLYSFATLFVFSKKKLNTNIFAYILILFAFVLMAIFEMIRLYLAYVGNLRERVTQSFILSIE
jgi:hypothetical protein